MLGKQAWRLISEQTTLWGQVMKGLYYPRCKFLEASGGSRPSWGWRSLLMGRESIRNHVMWSVGTGEKINIRTDRWLPSGKIGGQRLENEPHEVADLINIQKNEWNEPLLYEFFNTQLVQEVCTIPVNAQATADKLIWMESKSGDYSVKSNYNTIRKQDVCATKKEASSSYQAPKQLWTSIWHLNSPTKIKTFIWSVCQNALATKENLFRRKIITNPLCPICLRHEETLEHLFLLCSWTSTIWKHPWLNINISASQITRMEEWLAQFTGYRRKSPCFEDISAILWQIWKSRNEMVFRKKPINPQHVLVTAKFVLENYRKWSLHKRKSSKMRLSKEVLWVAPERNTIKVNIDAAYKPGSLEALVAGFCRNHEGVLVDGFLQQVRASSAEQAEMLAFVVALEFLATKPNERWIIESDCLNLVDSFKYASEEDRYGKIAWASRALVDKARGLLSHFLHLEILYYNRSSNRLVDWVLKTFLTSSLPTNWVIKPPSTMLDLICFDSPRAGFR